MQFRIFWERAIKGQIKSCFNCKHAIYREWADDPEAECTKPMDWEKIDREVEKYPFVLNGLEHYTAIHCPFYEALTAEEREERFRNYLHCIDSSMKQEKVGERG